MSTLFAMELLDAMDGMIIPEDMKENIESMIDEKAERRVVNKLMSDEKTSLMVDWLNEAAEPIAKAYPNELVHADENASKAREIWNEWGRPALGQLNDIFSSLASSVKKRELLYIVTIMLLSRGKRKLRTQNKNLRRERRVLRKAQR